MRIRLRKSDQLFRKYALREGSYTCARCGKVFDPTNCRGLHVSHYWRRSHENVRHDIQNVCLLCFPCHQIWGHGEEREQYTAFMRRKLGDKGFDLLDFRAHSYKKRDDKLDLIIVKALLEGK